MQQKINEQSEMIGELRRTIEVTDKQYIDASLT